MEPINNNKHIIPIGRIFGSTFFFGSEALHSAYALRAVARTGLARSFLSAACLPGFPLLQRTTQKPDCPTELGWRVVTEVHHFAKWRLCQGSNQGPEGLGKAGTGHWQEERVSS